MAMKPITNTILGYHTYYDVMRDNSKLETRSLKHPLVLAQIPKVLESLRRPG